MRALYASIVLLLAACSGGGEDPPPPNLCWRGEDPVVEEGRLELGAGLRSFEPVADEQDLLVERGAQGFYHFIINTRMWGLDPGDLSNPPEDNPQILLSAFFEDGRVVDALDCSYPVFCVEREDGDGFELYAGRPLVIADGLTDDIAGQRIRIVVEMVDVKQRHARDERWIVAISPGASDRADARSPDSLSPYTGSGDVAAAPTAE